MLLSSTNQFSHSVHFIAGGGAGMIAAGLTNPLDVAKTRLQTQGDMSVICKGKRYRGMLGTLRVIWIDEGIRGLTRGIIPRMMFHSFSASILWTTYEYFKYILGAEHDTDRKEFG